jgi:hypothetical protein
MEPALNKYRNNNSIILNYPLTLQPNHISNKKPHSLVSNKLIGKNNYVYLIDTNQIFASSNFIGASKNEEKMLNTKME